MTTPRKQHVSLTNHHIIIMSHAVFVALFSDGLRSR